MLKFKRIICEDGDTRYEVSRFKELLERFRPSNESCIGRKKWSKMITKEAVEFINYELSRKKKKLITKSEETQIFDFYYKGSVYSIKEEIKKHEKILKELKRKLNGF